MVSTHPGPSRCPLHPLVIAAEGSFFQPPSHPPIPRLLPFPLWTRLRPVSNLIFSVLPWLSTIVRLFLSLRRVFPPSFITMTLLFCSPFKSFPFSSRRDGHLLSRYLDPFFLFFGSNLSLMKDYVHPLGLLLWNNSESVTVVLFLVDRSLRLLCPEHLP